MTYFSSSKLLLLVSAIFVIGLLSISVSAHENAAPDVVVLREGNDFATLVLRDPWDMDSFTDISQGFNTFGAIHNFYDFRVNDGVFSARTGSKSSSYYVLYPGYQPGMNYGKTGVLYPIDTSRYKCLFIASNVESSSLSYQRVNWVPDKDLSGGGYTGGMQLMTGRWRLYSYDLSIHQPQSRSNWSSNDWMGLYLTPTNQQDKFFQVDWVRLTDCQKVEYTLTNLPPDSESLWIDTGSHEILVKGLLSQEISNGKLTLDVQGFQPGSYTLRVKDAGGNPIRNWASSLIIEPAPIPAFTNPSPTIGRDYATLAGNPWDMRDKQDVTWVHCANYAIRSDILFMDTLPPSNLPKECVGEGANEADPKVYLNTPISDNISEYRYLSFRHKIDGPWAKPVEGMVVRWIWEMGGLASKDCLYVSREVALDVGWHTYWVDLYDPWNGMPVEVGGLNASKCPFPVQWKSQPGVLSRFRLDPNENILSTTMHQEFDWIRLTKVPSVLQGNIFPVQVSMNKSVDKIRSINFYYTTDIKQPIQQRADGSIAGQNMLPDDQTITQLELTNPIFVPVVFSRFAPPVQLPQVDNEIRFDWDTGSVAPGEYYICAVTSDGYNRTTFCSQAPVKVKP